MSGMPLKSEKEWQAESDARTLAEANRIIEDKNRLSAARKAAERLAKDVADSLTALLKVTGKSDNKVEGMKVIG